MSDSRGRYRTIKSGLLQLYPQRLTGRMVQRMEVLALLTELRNLLPAAHPLILLGDGEFDSLELQHYVPQQGWHSVYRTTKDT